MPDAMSMLTLAVLLLIGLALFVAFLIAYTSFVLTHPQRRTYASALARGRPGTPAEVPGQSLAYTSWGLRWQGMDLPVWDVVGGKADGPAIVLSHGWGDSRIGALARIAALAPFASRLVTWDMPGHGDAPGTCSLGTREVDALRQLVTQVGGPVVLMGWSLGAGVSIAAAVNNPSIRAVIAEAPYRVPETPARNVLRSLGLPHRLNLPLALRILGPRFGVGSHWQGFDRAGLASQLSIPLLVLHGPLDDVCPIEDGRDIAAAARGTLIEIPTGGHHGLWTDPAAAETCRAAVASLLAGLPS